MTYQDEVQKRISAQEKNVDLGKATSEFMLQSMISQYSYNYSWLGRPIIQYPQDMVAIQELVWKVKPDLIIETGIAHGGSLMMSASMLALLDYCDAVEAGSMLDPRSPRRQVIGIDIDIRVHNRQAIENHPLAHRITMIQGSSIAPEIIEKVRAITKNYSKILICLDSNHTHDHVLAELEAYAPLTSIDSYCVVFDTVIEELPAGFFKDRPWDKGNNPKTAVWKYLESHPEFQIVKDIENKILITVAPDGYLKRVS